MISYRGVWITMKSTHHTISCLLALILIISLMPAAFAEGKDSTPEHSAPWDHIVSVACGDNFTIGLRSDGRVAYAGDNHSEEIQKIAEWKDIQRIEVLDGNYAVGYEEDGGIRLATVNKTAVSATWDDSDVADWSAIRQVYIIQGCCVGLREDGKIRYTDWDTLAFHWGFDEDWDGIEDIQWGQVPDLTPIPCGIRKDGTLMGFQNGYKYLFPDMDIFEPEESGWHDITNLYGTESAMYALRSDGRICCYSNLSLIDMYYEDDHYDPLVDVMTWTDVVDFHCNLRHYSPVALRRDGTVVTLRVNSMAEEISGWRDVKEIIGYGDRFLLGIRKDGTVLSAGFHEAAAREIASWTDVKSIISAGECYLALRDDGTVLAVSVIEYPEADESEIMHTICNWTDVEELVTYEEAYSYENHHTVGLRSDGTVVGAGNNSAGQLNFDADSPLQTHDETAAEDHGTAADNRSGEAEAVLSLQTEGACGENLNWRLDESGCLRIFGTGAMENYGKPIRWTQNSKVRAAFAPWYPVREKIKKVGIDPLAFKACTNLKSIVLPESLEYIDAAAFMDCPNLQRVLPWGGQLGKDVHVPDPHGLHAGSLRIL